MWCSTASTTTIASSTTMPIASTRPKSVRLLRLKPITFITAKVPMMATGTAIKGMIAERQFCRNKSTTRATRMIASRRRLDHFLDALPRIGRGVVADHVVQVVGEVLGQLLHLRPDLVAHLQGVGVGQLEDDQARRAQAVAAAAQVLVLGPQHHAAHVADADDAAVGRGAEDDVGELRRGSSAGRAWSRGSASPAPAAPAAAPICPQATSAFCSRSAATTSPAVRFRAASLSGSTQIRML